MRIVFMGTPKFAATILENIVDHHEVVAVYTRPDAIRGRGKEVEASPVKRIAEQLDIPVCTPKTLRNAETQQQLVSLQPDVIAVAAYGAILPKEVLDIPLYGCLNVHASLLPRWRGAAPIERSILSGDKETGVCVMKMEEGLDTGDYCICRTAVIDSKTTEELTDELSNLGSQALLTALYHIQKDEADWIEQDSSQVTYAEKIGSHELYLSPENTATQAVLKVRASSSAHPCRAVVADRSVTVVRAADISNDDHALRLSSGIGKGDVWFLEKRLFLGSADKAFEVLEVKPDGKNTMEAKAFAAGIQNIKSNNLVWKALEV